MHVDVPSSATTSKTPEGSRFGGEGSLFPPATCTKLTNNLESSKPNAPASLEPSSSQPLKSPAGRNPRTPRRPGTQPVRLQALDDSLGPLGPLGDNAPVPQADEPPVPPQKEQVLTHNIRQQPPASAQGKGLFGDDDDDVAPNQGPRIPPPVQPAAQTPARRDTQPSVSIEQAAKPTFDISVGDPHKVGDLTSSHIVYLVRTKVCMKSRWIRGRTDACRLHLKLIDKPSSLSLVDTEIFYGFTTRCMRTTLVLWYLLLQRNKLSTDMSPISWSREELR